MPGAHARRDFLRHAAAAAGLLAGGVGRSQPPANHSPAALDTPTVGVRHPTPDQLARAKTILARPKGGATLLEQI